MKGLIFLMGHRAWGMEQRDIITGSCAHLRVSRHMPSASLGQDAALSFVARGGGQQTEVRRQKKTGKFFVVTPGLSRLDRLLLVR